MKKFLHKIKNLTTSSFIKDKKGRLVFLAQEKADWIKEGKIVRVPFSGIGGKTKINESPLKALIREISEEINGKLKIEQPTKKIIFCDNLGNYFSDELTNLIIEKKFSGKIKPQLIIANIYNTTNYSKFKPSLIGVYRAIIDEIIYPIGENPYLLYLDYSLLIESYKRGISLKKVEQKKGIIFNQNLKKESISLPINFFPIGDARLLAILAIRKVYF